MKRELKINLISGTIFAYLAKTVLITISYLLYSIWVALPQDYFIYFLVLFLLIIMIIAGLGIYLLFEAKNCALIVLKIKKALKKGI